MPEKKHFSSRWDSLFFYLHRFNAVMFLIVLSLVGIVALIGIFQSGMWNDDYRYGEDAFSQEHGEFEGGTIETSDGQVVSYVVEPFEQGDMQIVGKNLSFTAMGSGNSKLVLPDGGEQIVLNWEELRLRHADAKAYSVIAGSVQDYKEGVLDWVVGRFSDLEQKTIARRVRYIDAPQMIDADTMSVIVWPTEDRAEFWLVDLRDLTVVSRRKVALPLPRKAANFNSDDDDVLRAIEALSH